MMQKRPNIIHWYYNQGINELLEIWKNFLFFVWQHFSISELLMTLFSPWRRDVAVSSWRGFHPVKLLGILFENIISRVLGAIVRMTVALFGLALSLIVAVLGFALNIFWITAPIVFVGAFVFLPKINVDPLYVLVAMIAWILLVTIFYFKDTTEPMLLIGVDRLLKNHVFERICGRFGISRKRFPDEIFGNKELFNEFLRVRNMTEQEYLSIANWELERDQEKKDSVKFWRWEFLKGVAAIGRQWRYGYTVHLDRYCSDLSTQDFSQYAKTKLVGRSDESEVLKLVLQRSNQNCALIVGSAGVGRKTMIHSFARSIRTNEEESSLSIARILLLDLGRVISDAISRGEDVENSLRILFYEACRAGNVILVVEHLEHYLANSGSSFHPEISAVFEEFLHIPTFRIIATSTVKEYHQMIEKQESVAKYFEIIEMREPSDEEAVLILLDYLEKYESKRVLFTFKALQKIVRDSEKHNGQSPLPERAIDLAMGALMFWEKKSDEQFVSEKTIDDYLSLKTGVAQGDIEGVERKKLMNLEELLHRQVIGQDEAINQVSGALRRARSGIGNSKKPVGSFLFLGPTGVGKTETAKALAKIYFGSEDKMIRLDMSEFQTPSSIDRLLGSSQLNQPGRLVTQIKDNPYSLLLLDEIEKAYPEILDIFLQILDEGFVNDAFGNKISFRNTLIVATSNVGGVLIKDMVERENSPEEIKQAVIDHAIENAIFRTEFLNRFEGIIFFRPLNGNELKSVVRLQLQKFMRRLAKEKNIEVSFDEGIVEKIIEKGYDPIFGARSLNRYMESEVEDFVAKKIIAGEISQGGKIALSL